jgi:hypothetical protein
MFFEPKSKVEEKKFASRINSTHVHAMSNVYDLIFDAFPQNFGKMLSKKERSEKQLYDTSLIYGEIDYDSFGRFYFATEVEEIPDHKIHEFTICLIYKYLECFTAMALQKIVDVYGKPDVGSSGEEGVLQNRGGMFYDLGSGVGKAVIGESNRHTQTDRQTDRDKHRCVV